MTIILLTLAVLVLVDLVALVRGLRRDPPRRPPREASDWGTDRLPTLPYAR